MVAGALLAAAESRAGEVIGVEAVSPRIDVVTFHSDVLGTDKRFGVVKPAGYDAGRDGPWPVLYLFHGRGRHERSLIDHETARAHLLDAPFVIALPDGDDGWYINSPARPEDRYFDYTRETIGVAESMYPLSSDPGERALSGWSMGGYGCVRFAQQRPGRFAAVAPIIGLLDYPSPPESFPPGQRYAVPADRFTDDPDVWREHNPLHHAEALRGVAVLQITGGHAFDRTMNLRFSKRLGQSNIDHRYVELTGGHTFDIVVDALPHVIEYVEDVFVHGGREQVSADP